MLAAVAVAVAERPAGWHMVSISHLVNSWWGLAGLPETRAGT